MSELFDWFDKLAAADYLFCFLAGFAIRDIFKKRSR